MEYSEEEKKAIKKTRKEISKCHNLNNINIFLTNSTTLKTLLNLIEKQQKEIDRLTYGRNFLFDNICAQNWTPEMFNSLVEENYIPKEAIREKVKGLKERIRNLHPASDCVIIDDLENQIKAYEELLGE